MNDKNLTPFDRMPAEKHREISRLGGIASGKARREKRIRIEAKKERARRAEAERERLVASILRRYGIK